MTVYVINSTRCGCRAFKLWRDAMAPLAEWLNEEYPLQAPLAIASLRKNKAVTIYDDDQTFRIAVHRCEVE